MQSIHSIRKRSTFYCLIAWLLTGVIIVAAVFFTYGSNFSKLSFSIENNDVYDLDNTVINNAQIQDNCCMMDFTVYLEDGHFNINYLRLKVKGIQDENVTANVYGFGSDDEKSLLILDAPIRNGINDFELDYTDLNWVRIEINGTGEKVVKSAQFRESTYSVPITGALPWMLLAAVAYVLLSLIIVKLLRKISFVTGSERQETAEQCHRETDLIPSKQLFSVTKAFPLVRIAVFLVIIMASFIIQIKGGEAEYNDHFREYLLFQLAAIAIATVFLNDSRHPISRKNKDIPAIIVCAGLASYTLISDLAVDKLFRFSGLGAFIFLLIFAYVWSNRRHSEIYIKEYELTVQCFLVLLVLTSVFFKDNIDDGRFSGPLTNPSIYALYLSGIWAVLMGSLENHLIRKSKGPAFVTTIVEMAVVLILSFMSGSVTPLLSMIAITGLFIFRIVNIKKGRQKALLTILLLGAAGVVTIALLSWYVKSADIADSSRLAEKLDSANLTSLLSGRNYYWKAYLRKMNLLGHSKKPFLWDHRILPHNAIIGVAYMYGVPCIIPYILMMIMAVEKSWRYANTRVKYSAVPFYSIVSFIILSMADNVEQPFVWLPWISCYLLMAPILIMRVEDIVAMKISDEDTATKAADRIGKHDKKRGYSSHV